MQNISTISITSQYDYYPFGVLMEDRKHMLLATRIPCGVLTHALVEYGLANSGAAPTTVAQLNAYLPGGYTPLNTSLSVATIESNMLVSVNSTGDVVTPQAGYSASAEIWADGSWNPSSNTRFRYGFNNKEKDDEMDGDGEGDSYDYGARMYDSRVGKWLTIDAKVAKYPSESPYSFGANSPLVVIDPNGEEKIVVTGGADLHNKNRMNFIMAAKNELKTYRNEVKKAGSGEAVTWLILDRDYTADDKKSFEVWANKHGVAPPVFVSSAQDVKNYINSKSITNANLSTARISDGISSLSFMSHGVPGIIALGYDNTNWSGLSNDPTNFGAPQVKGLKDGAFMCGSKVEIYSCNSATPTKMQSKDYSSEDLLVTDAMQGNNLVKQFSQEVPESSVTGFIGQTSYAEVGNGELPKGATLDGSYSPTVNKQHPSTIKVKMRNGKITK